MNTSAKRAPAPGRASAPLAEFEPFPYDAIPAGFRDRRAQNEESEVSPEAAAAARELQARREGHQAGEAEARKLFEEQLVQERASISAALAGFTRDRAAYFEKIEGEIVELALSIARKILHREAQIDPLLLAGIVRIALDQLEANTQVTLRIHPVFAADCRAFLAHHMDPRRLPEVFEDATLEMNRCVLQTALG